jgi:predicted helicase
LIHDDVVIPAERRLSMTTTRKVLGVGGDDSDGSMGDETIYGPVIFRFTHLPEDRARSAGRPSGPWS